MTENNEIIDLLTAIVSTIESRDQQAQQAKTELLKKLTAIASNTDKVSTNFPKLIETMSNFDSKIASSFEDIQNVSKRLNSVVEQVGIAEKALLNVQQQSQKLRLDETVRSINYASADANHLNEVLKNTSSTYTAKMKAATEEAFTQIKNLKDEISAISESFADIVSKNVSKRVVSDVSQKLTQKIITDLQTQIETGAKETAQKLAITSFQHLESTLDKAKQDVEIGAKSFHEEVISTYKYDLERLKTLSIQIQETAEESNKIYMQREKAYQAHVSEEKAVVKRNWFIIVIGAWLLFMTTVIFVGHFTQKSTARIVDDATGYVTLQNNLKNIGFRTTSNEFCSGFLPKKTFEFYSSPKVSFCYLINKKPIQHIQTDYGYLMIFGE